MMFLEDVATLQVILCVMTLTLAQSTFAISLPKNAEIFQWTAEMIWTVLMMFVTLEFASTPQTIPIVMTVSIALLTLAIYPLEDAQTFQQLHSVMTPLTALLIFVFWMVIASMTTSTKDVMITVRF
jgi:hypothetical protein